MAGERVEHSLQTTALIHEAYLRLVGPSPWPGRAADTSSRRGPGHAPDPRRPRPGPALPQARGRGRPVTLDEQLVVAGGPDRDLVSLDDALQALATFDERKARVVEMRFFGGLSVEETAEVLKVSPQTVLRDWKLAKVWLLREMKRGEAATRKPGEPSP